MTEAKSVEDKSKYISEMRSWIISQPHLPKEIDDGMLLRFVHCCYYDVDKAKAAAESFFNIRLSAPDLLDDRDPMSPEMQKVMKITKLGQVMTDQNECIWFWQLNDPGLENYDYLRDARFFMMSTDAYFLNDAILPEVDIVILDVKDISLKILTKLNLSIARKLAKYQQDAIPIRLKQVHLINAPSSMDRIFGVMKPFLKKELTDLVYFHTPNSTTLHDYVDKKFLPTDYGGSQPCMAEQNEKIVAVIMEKRKELLSNSLWRAIPTDKKKVTSHTTSPVVTTFRALAID